MSDNGHTKGAIGLDFIDSLMAKSRSRGAYQPKLEFFATETDEPAINVREQWEAEFGSKTAEALAQSFNSWIKKADLEDVIVVRKDEDDVYLIHLQRYQAARAEAEATA
jgi:hypothetical protein